MEEKQPKNSAVKPRERKNTGRHCRNEVGNSKSCSRKERGEGNFRQ